MNRYPCALRAQLHLPRCSVRASVPRAPGEFVCDALRARQALQARSINPRLVSVTRNANLRDRLAISPDRACCRFYLRYDVGHGAIGEKGGFSSSRSRYSFLARDQGVAEANAV